MKRETIQIPQDITAAVKELTAIEELLTAKQWAKAAIVATYVDPGVGSGAAGHRGRQVSESGHLESARAFADRGIRGLSSASTVLLYASAWLDRFDRPKPGQKLVLPQQDWPPTRTGTDGFNSEAGLTSTINKMVEQHGPEAVGRAVGQHTEATHSAIREQFGPRTRPDVPFTEPPVGPMGRDGDDFVTFVGMLRKASDGLDTAAVWLHQHPRILRGKDTQSYWVPLLKDKLDRLLTVIEAVSDLDSGLTDADIASLLDGGR